MRTLKQIFSFVFFLTVLTAGAFAEGLPQQPTLTAIQDALKGQNFKIVAQEPQRKSEILTTTAEEAIREDVQNAVHGMELRYTLKLNAVLIFLGEDGLEKNKVQFGQFILFFTVREKQDEKFPVDLGISFEFPEGNSVTTLAQTKITEEEIDLFLSDKFKENAGNQLSQKLGAEFETLSGPEGDAFKSSLHQFVTAFTTKILTQSRETLVRMLEQYPQAEKSILMEARKKYPAEPAA